MCRFIKYNFVYLEMEQINFINENSKARYEIGEKDIKIEFEG